MLLLPQSSVICFRSRFGLRSRTPPLYFPSFQRVHHALSPLNSQNFLHTYPSSPLPSILTASRFPPAVQTLRSRLLRHQVRTFVLDPVTANTIAYSLIALCSTSTALYYGATRTFNVRLSLWLQRNSVCSLENIHQGRWWTLLTSSITHFELMHLGINMYMIYQWAPLILTNYGLAHFAGIWSVGAICCSGASLLLDVYRRRRGRISSNERVDPTEQFGGSVGASGSLSGILMLLAMVAPSMGVAIWGILPMTLGQLQPVIAIGSVAAMWFGWAPRVGHAGHLGGMAGGWLYWLTFVR